MHIHQINLPIQPRPRRWADGYAFFAADTASVRVIHKNVGFRFTQPNLPGYPACYIAF